MASTNLVDDADATQLAAFGRAFLRRYMAWGFQSLSKKDIESLIYFALEDNEIVDPHADNYEVARTLHLTASRVTSLRREAYARWATDAQRRELLRTSLRRYFSGENIEGVLSSVRRDHLAEGFLPILLEHPVERAEFEQALKSHHLVPRYARNRQVLLVKFDWLLTVLEAQELIKVDKKLLARVQTALNEDSTLAELLGTDVRNLSVRKARAAIGNTVAGGLAQLAESGVAALLERLGAALLAG